MQLVEETVAPDEAAVTAEFIAFLKAASARRHPSGVMPRFNQGRAAGCVDAELTVQEQTSRRNFVSESSRGRTRIAVASGLPTQRRSPIATAMFGACRSRFWTWRATT